MGERHGAHFVTRLRDALVQEMDLSRADALITLSRIMSGYGQICPVAVASEVFAQRWTPLILREIFAGSSHFNEIHRGLPLISRTLLARRLRQLEEAGILISAPVARGQARGYRLTDAGAEFKPVIEGLGSWGQRCTVRVTPENLDAAFLMWNVRRRIALERLPEQRIVVQFEFHDLPPRHRGPHVFWLILDRPQVELCVTDPGAEIDLYVSAELRTFAQIWLGDMALSVALKNGGVRLMGRHDLAQAFPSWLLLSHFAPVPRPHVAAASVPTAS
jgi:DNA-binding HxlR family transcriptional regulator